LRQSLIRVSEKGEGVVTPQLLIDTILDALAQTHAADEFDTVCPAYLVGAMNQLARCGLTEPNPPSGGSKVSSPPTPSDPPPFFKGWDTPECRE
jgi:hypothetical protein